MEEEKKYVLGEILTVRTVPGRDGKPIARLPDGRVVLFDQNSEFFDKLAPNQSVEGHVIVISESYMILKPSKKPEDYEPLVYHVHYPDLEVDDIVQELETLIKKVKGNAEIIPRALLRLIQLNQLQIRMLKDSLEARI